MKRCRVVRAPPAPPHHPESASFHLPPARGPGITDSGSVTPRPERVDDAAELCDYSGYEPPGDENQHPHHQRYQIVPSDVEYDEYPRGRVAYNAKTRQYWLFADACILKNKAAIRQIMNDFRLPSNTKKDKD